LLQVYNRIAFVNVHLIESLGEFSFHFLFVAKF
jgi:hypothetical protein